MRASITHVINGVTYLDFISGYNYDYKGQATPTLRYLKPDSPAFGVPARFVYLMPVERSVPAVTYGDGLNIIKAANLHNQYNLTLIAPAFSTAGTWCCDDDRHAYRRHESFLLELQAWAKANLSRTGSERQWVMGFSRSGYGVVDLIMRNPAAFHACAAFDFPADWGYKEMAGYDYPHGSLGNFENNYQLTQSFVTKHSAPFRLENRLWLASGPTFTAHVAIDFKRRLDAADAKYTLANCIAQAHTWNLGWVAPALAALNEMDSSARKAEIIPEGLPSMAGLLSAAPILGLNWIIERRQRLQAERQSSRERHA